jgi:integrase
MAGGLNEAAVKALPTPEKGNKVHYFAGAVLQGTAAPRGFGVRVTAGGSKAFVLNYRLRGREYRYTIGQHPDWSALRAVREARELRQRIDRGENPLDDRASLEPVQAPKTVGDVIEDFLSRYVRAPARPLRSATEYEYALRKLVVPAIGKTPIHELRRSKIAELLDTIADQHGPVQSDRSLAYFRKCLNWYATRDDDFVPPIAKGMARTRGSERARSRTLSDDEIRLFWPALEEAGTFGALCKTMLLTAQRGGEVGGMRRSEIENSVWVIPAERYKSKRAQAVPLSKAAVAVIEAQKASDYVFPQRKGTRFTMFGKGKAELDAAITAANGGAGLPHWTLHDLRRTAKTLMIRAGVRPDISERVLGHVIAGVEGVYDRHSYMEEKREALEKLAVEIDRILNPPQLNVLPIRQEAQS